MSNLTGIAGILIYTGNFEPMATFYRDTLGLKPRSVKPKFINFEWGELRLTINGDTHLTGPAIEPGRMMINFTVDDIHSTVARLTCGGVCFVREPEREWWGGMVATFHDPDGNTLQLFELPK